MTKVEVEAVDVRRLGVGVVELDVGVEVYVIRLKRRRLPAIIWTAMSILYPMLDCWLLY